MVFGAASKLAFLQQPSNAVSTATITPAVTVRVLDASNNLVANSSAPVTLVIGTNPGSGTLSGTLTQNAVNGVATFANLSIDKIGPGYTLAASSSGLTGATSSAFNITIGAAAKLAFFTQPSDGTPNTAFPTQPRVEVQDAGGNRRTSNPGGNANITLAIVSGTGAPGAVLTCTTNPLVANSGLATFAGCRINLAGNNYQLRATASGLASADSDPFDITATNQPPTVNAGGPYTVAEGTELALTPTVNDPDGDPLTYLWSVNTTGIDAGGGCTFDNPAAKNAKVTCTDDSQGAPGGKFTLTLQVNDGTAPPVSGNADLTVTNAIPTANAGGPYPGDEGSAISLNGSGDDPGDNDDAQLGYQWTVVTTGIDANGSCSFDNAASKTAKVTCTDDGAFKVRLVVADGDGGTSAVSEADLTVANVDPVATAGGSYTGNEGAAIQLTGTATDAGTNDVLTKAWSFAPGAGVDAGATCSFSPNAAALSPTVSCTDDGVYQLTLMVIDDDGGSHADNASLTLQNVAPVADAGTSYTGYEGSPVQLNGSVTDAGANDTHTWSWQYMGTNVDPGATCSFSDPSAEDPTITCTDDGTVKLTLTVTDDDDASSSDEATLTLQNVAPVATAGGSYTGDEGAAVQLTGTATDAGTNDVLTKLWSYAPVSGVDAGATCSFLPNASALSPTVSCTDDGVYQLTLTVTDDDLGSDAADATLTLQNVAPVADAGTSYTGYEGSPVQLNGSVTDAGANDTHTWSWQYMGTNVDPGATCSFSDPGVEDPTITCTDDGTVELTLTVTDDDGASSSDEATLTLQNVAPVATAGGSYTGNEGAAIQLTGTATDAGTNDVLTKAWSFAPGAGVDAGATCSFSPNAAALSPTVSCTDDGVYQLTLMVIDDDGGSHADNASLTLQNVAPVADAGTSYTGYEGSPVQLNGSVTDAGANDTHTWSWQYMGTNVDPGATCSFSDPGVEDPTITCTDDGTVELTLTVTDDDGASSSDEATLTLQNVAPVATAGGSYTGNEGAAIQLTGTATDAGTNDVLTKLWSYAPVSGVDAGATCSFSPNASVLSPSVTCTDDGAYQLTLTVTDDDLGVGTSEATLTLANLAPAMAGLAATDGSSLPTTLIVAGTLTIKTTFSDLGSNDTHAAQIDCGSGFVSLGASSISPFNSACTFATIGAKTIQVKVTDDDGGYAVQTHNILVKYNFDGFYAPVDRPNTMNVSKAGQAIPLKWRLTDANGVAVSNVVAVTIRAKDLACAAGATTDLMEEYASGASGLQNQGDGRYQFNWKTPTTYASSCKTVELVFGTGGLSYVDGPHAYFSFKK